LRRSIIEKNQGGPSFEKNPKTPSSYLFLVLGNNATRTSVTEGGYKS